MSKIAQVRSYIFSPTQCYPPICNSRCCKDVPLPEDFYEMFRSMAQLPVTGAVNIGKNDPRDPFNSIIYNTTNIPILPIGHGDKGAIVCTFDERMLKKLGKDTPEGRREMLEAYKQSNNYCPFIMRNGRCSVYEQRPGICREFGTLPDRQNRCTHKSSRFDIAKYWVKDFFNFKRAYYFYKALILKQVDKIHNSSKHLIKTPVH